MIKKIIILPLLLISINLVYCQTYSILDSLKDNIQISNYINLNFKQNSPFEIPDTIKKYDNLSDKLIKKKNIKPVYRIDFNNDHIIDMIIIHEYFSIMYLVRDLNQNKILFRYLPKSGSGTFIIPQIRNHLTVFEFYYPEYLSVKNKFENQIKLHKKIIVYRDSNFIEYNNKVKPYNVNEINIEMTGCLGKCPAFKMKIKSNGQLSIEPKPPFDYLPVQRKAIAQLDSNSLSQIINLLYNIDFTHLKTEYNIGSTDNPTGYLEIIYNNSKTVKIKDYGMEGTFGLMLLFSEVRKILYKCNWKDDN